MGPLLACVQNGVSGSYMDYVFKLVAHKESRDLDKSSTQFYQGRLATAPKLVECCASRDVRAINGRHDQVI